MRATLIDAEIAIKPNDWRDPEIARRRFRVQWCADAGIPEHACETPEHADQELARQRWCDGLDILDIEDCTERFREIDAAFEDEWKVEREAHIDNIRGPDLRGRDLRNADASGAFLAGVDLREARLEGANLVEARLERADLGRARLDAANLWGARLERANLREARLERANLYQARLEGANLGGARLEGADLAFARLDGANLRFARLERARLDLAQLEGTDLYRARLEGANLREAQLERANLKEAQLEGADLGGARLERADLREARLERAELYLARLFSAEWAGATVGTTAAHSADFTDGRNLTQRQLEHVIGDEETILPRDAETGKSLHVWSCWQEEAAARYVELWWQRRGRTAEDYRQRLIDRGWICGPENQRRPVGTAAEDVVGGYR